MVGAGCGIGCPACGACTIPGRCGACLRTRPGPATGGSGNCLPSSGKETDRRAYCVSRMRLRPTSCLQPRTGCPHRSALSVRPPSGIPTSGRSMSPGRHPEPLRRARAKSSRAAEAGDSVSCERSETGSIQVYRRLRCCTAFLRRRPFPATWRALQVCRTQARPAHLEHLPVANPSVPVVGNAQVQVLLDRALACLGSRTAWRSAM